MQSKNAEQIQTKHRKQHTDPGTKTPKRDRDSQYYRKDTRIEEVCLAKIYKNFIIVFNHIMALVLISGSRGVQIGI